MVSASGMSAILSTCLGLLKSGYHIDSSRSIFGSTTMLFTNYLAKLGIQTTFVKLTDIDDWAAAIRLETRLMFMETPSNPLTELAEYRAYKRPVDSYSCAINSLQATETGAQFRHRFCPLSP
jgi:O-succinylhomoserine sulfhydrylase